MPEMVLNNFGQRSLVSVPFTYVALAVGAARRCPDSSRLCTGVWYKENKNEEREGRE